jgi:serpin B
LKEALEGLGIKTLFKNSANLSGINGKRNLKVSKAIHKAFIEVNEEGAEAAAATGVNVVLKSSRYETIRVDRPFMFLIIDHKSRIILFLGQVRKISV